MRTSTRTSTRITVKVFAFACLEVRTRMRTDTLTTEQALTSITKGYTYKRLTHTEVLVTNRITNSNRHVKMIGHVVDLRLNQTRFCKENAGCGTQQSGRSKRATCLTRSGDNVRLGRFFDVENELGKSQQFQISPHFESYADRRKISRWGWTYLTFMSEMRKHDRECLQ